MRLGKHTLENETHYAAYYLSSMYLNLYELYTHTHTLTHFSTQAQVLEKHTHKSFLG